MPNTKTSEAPEADAPDLRAYLKEEEVAAYLSLDADEMRILRRSGDGPPCSDLDGYIRYPKAGFEAWLHEREEVSKITARLLRKMSTAEMAANLLSPDHREEALDRMVTFVFKEARRNGHE